MKQFKRLIIPYFIWAIVILVIPLFLIVLYAFTTEGNEVMTLSFTWGNFVKFLEATYLNVILKSFWLGLLTTFICLILGYPCTDHCKMFRKNSGTSDHAGNHSNVDQHASSYLCLDESVV